MKIDLSRIVNPLWVPQRIAAARFGMRDVRTFRTLAGKFDIRPTCLSAQLIGYFERDLIALEAHLYSELKNRG